MAAINANTSTTMNYVAWAKNITRMDSTKEDLAETNTMETSITMDPSIRWTTTTTISTKPSLTQLFHQLPLQILPLQMVTWKPIATWTSTWVPVTTFSAKQLEELERRYSRMPKRDSNSSNNMKQRRKLNCAETSKCMVHANSVILAHMLTESINFKRKHISQATSKLSFALNSTKKDFAYMVKDANSYTASSIWKHHWAMLKPFVKEEDLPSKEIIKSAVIQTLNASGLTWRAVMVVEHQKDHVFNALKTSITRKTCKRTWESLNKKTKMKKIKDFKPNLPITDKWSSNQCQLKPTHALQASTTSQIMNKTSTQAKVPSKGLLVQSRSHSCQFIKIVLYDDKKNWINLTNK